VSRNIWQACLRIRTRVWHFITCLRLSWMFTIVVDFYNCRGFLQLSWIFTIVVDFYDCRGFLRLSWIFFSAPSNPLSHLSKLGLSISSSTATFDQRSQFFSIFSTFKNMFSTFCGHFLKNRYTFCKYDTFYIMLLFTEIMIFNFLHLLFGWNRHT
jgi:hypothetical protein